MHHTEAKYLTPRAAESARNGPLRSLTSTPGHPERGREEDLELTISVETPLTTMLEFGATPSIEERDGSHVPFPPARLGQAVVAALSVTCTVAASVTYSNVLNKQLIISTQILVSGKP